MNPVVSLLLIFLAALVFYALKRGGFRRKIFARAGIVLIVGLLAGGAAWSVFMGSMFSSGSASAGRSTPPAQPSPQASPEGVRSRGAPEENFMGASEPLSPPSGPPGLTSNIPGYAVNPNPYYFGQSSMGYMDDSRIARSPAGVVPGLPPGEWRTSGAPRMGLQDTARYAPYEDNPAEQSDESISTFGLDVDTASYANVRRFLNGGRFPPADAIRVEEMINYFPPLREEQQAEALEKSPFRVSRELAPCPWNPENLLLWLTVEAYSLDYQDAPPANLVFLVDVSGSMGPPERLPLAQASLRLLTERLRPEDRVSIVTYAGSVGVALGPTPGSEPGKARIQSVIDGLGAGGSTAGGTALQMAYEQAEAAFMPNGINRILLCTDGDFNVGVSDTESLTRRVAEQRQKGITLSVLGFGTDNLNDAMMVSIADSGNGNYSYIDGLLEARKVLDEEMAATLVTVAKDVKAQVEFNPAVIQEFRQIGYEKRQLRREDFNNDKVDAGDIGAGKRVTVLYELTPAGKDPAADPLRYRDEARAKEPEEQTASSGSNFKNEAAWLKLRWKYPKEDVSLLAELPILNTPAPSFEDAGRPLRFAAAAAAFGQKLRGNPELSSASWKDIAAWAENARGGDEGGYRAELVRLIGLAESLETSKVGRLKLK